jgi:uncharacterized membrane protein
VKVERGSFPVVAVVLLLPVVSAVASYLVARNVLLVVYLVMASTVFVALLRADRVSHDGLFRILTISVSLSLLLSSTLISDSLHGWDIHQEFALFQQVLRSGSVQVNAPSMYNSALSVTILPTAISIVSGLDGIHVFMLVFPVLFSMVSMVLYETYRRLLPPEGAFLSVFLAMSVTAYYIEMVGLARQQIGEVILVTLVMLLSGGVIKRRSSAIVAMVLTVGLAISHYSLSYIYLIVLAFSLVFSRAYSRNVALTTVGGFMLSAGIVASWLYFIASSAALVNLGNYLALVVENVRQDFFNPGSRPETAMQALGMAATVPGYLHDANRITQYLVVLSVLFGFVAILHKPEKTVYERRMLPMMAVGVLMMITGVVMPGFAGGFNFSRFYQVSLLFMSPCFIYGARSIQRLSGRAFQILRQHDPIVLSPIVRKKWILAVVLLFCYFLFVSGWVWSTSKDRPTSVILDKERMLTYPGLSLRVWYYEEFTVSEDIAGARWASFNLWYERMLCADYRSRWNVLASYGGFQATGSLPNACDLAKSYVYLSALNTLHMVGTNWDENTWSISDISVAINAKNRIYSNGATTIYE